MFISVIEVDVNQQSILINKAGIQIKNRYILILWIALSTLMRALTTDLEIKTVICKYDTTSIYIYHISGGKTIAYLTKFNFVMFIYYLVSKHYFSMNEAF